MTFRFTIIISGFKSTAPTTLDACLNLALVYDGGVEVIFVDNTREGMHRAIVEGLVRAKGLNPRLIRYIPVPLPGKAMAQNEALRSSCGKFIVCLDDDVLPDASLLVEYERAFDAYPCAAVQGRVALYFEGVYEIPSWLDSRLRLDLAEMDFGKIIYPFEMGLTGANMAFRREVFERYGLFDERFGPGRTGTLEDQEFSERIRAAGETQLFWPGASVRHRIPPERLRVKSFAKIHYDVGFSDYLLSRHLIKGGPLKFALYTVRQFITHCRKAIFAGATGRYADAIYQYCELYRSYGYYRQYLQSRGSKT